MDKIVQRQIGAGKTLRRLIQENYPSQEAFAYEYGLDIRTVSRYINRGINGVDVIQALADHFGVSFLDFFPDN